MGKIFIIIILISLSIFYCNYILAQNVTISPSTLQAANSSDFSLALNVDSVADLFGIAFDLNFDPTLVSFKNAIEGNFLSQGCQTSLMTNVNPAGKLIFGLTRLGASCGGVSGSGTLATLNFRSLNQGGSNTPGFSKNYLCILSASGCNYVTGTWTSAIIVVSLSSGASACSSFTYSGWSTCQSNNVQSRTIVSSLPSGCTGGNPILTQSCAYVPPGGGGGGGGGSYNDTTPPSQPSNFQSISSAQQIITQSGVGKTTGVKVDEILGKKAAATTTAAATKILITRNLYFGLKHQEVNIFQQFLSNYHDKTIYPEAMITGYFGLFTQRAVQRFQCTYHIVCSGTSNTTGYGLVGPKTRAKLNEMIVK